MCIFKSKEKTQPNILDENAYFIKHKQKLILPISTQWVQNCFKQNPVIFY